MQTRKFMLEIDFHVMNEWLDKHGHPMVNADELPVSGFAVEDHGAPVCFAFLRMVEGPIAIAESLVTDPDVPLLTAVRAIDTMTEHVFKVAIDRNIKYLFSTTSSTGVSSHLLKRHGYIKSQQQLLIKKLS